MEKWKDVKGYEGYYEVSNLGRVRSLERLIVCSKYKRVYPSKVLKFGIDGSGYLRCAIGVNGKSKTFKVHRLVASAFLENPKNLPQVNHIDGDKKNNHVYNLEWCDNSHNIKHAFDIGLIQPMRGKDNPASKLTQEDVDYIRKVYKPRDKEFSTVALGRKYGVHRKTIGRIVNGVHWKEGDVRHVN